MLFLCLITFVGGIILFSWMFNDIDIFSSPRLIKYRALATFLTHYLPIEVLFGALISAFLGLITIYFKCKTKDELKFIIVCATSICLVFPPIICSVYSLTPNYEFLNNIIRKLNSPDVCGYIEIMPHSSEDYRSVYYAFLPVLKWENTHRDGSYEINKPDSAEIERGVQRIIDLVRYEKAIADIPHEYIAYIKFLKENFPDIKIPERVESCYLANEKKSGAKNDDIYVIKMSFIISKILDVEYDWRNKLKKCNLYIIPENSPKPTEVLEKYFPVDHPDIGNLSLYFDGYPETPETKINKPDKKEFYKEMVIKFSQNYCSGWLYFLYRIHPDQHFNLWRKAEINISAQLGFKAEFEAVDQTLVAIFSPEKYKPFHGKSAGTQLNNNELKQFQTFLKGMGANCKPSIGYQIVLFR
jgi:hypothetical protein